MKYKIESAAVKSDLESVVNMSISEGWTLNGGVSVTAIKAGPNIYKGFYQAMTHDEGASTTSSNTSNTKSENK